MTVSELRDLVRRSDLPSGAVVLDGEPSDEAYVLEDSGSGWSVYYAERGLRTGEQRFDSEEDACEALLRILRRDFGVESEAHR